MLCFDIQIKLRFLGNIIRIKLSKEIKEKKTSFEDKLHISFMQEHDSINSSRINLQSWGKKREKKEKKKVKVSFCILQSI